MISHHLQVFLLSYFIGSLNLEGNQLILSADWNGILKRTKNGSSSEEGGATEEMLEYLMNIEIIEFNETRGLAGRCAWYNLGVMWGDWRRRLEWDS